MPDYTQIKTLVNSPPTSVETPVGTVLTSVGNTLVYPMSGDCDRPQPTRRNELYNSYYTPIMSGFYGAQSGCNPNDIAAATVLRDTNTLRIPKSGLQTQESAPYTFGMIFNSQDTDLLVDPSVTYNHVWEIGHQSGVSTRNLQRNCANN